MENERTVIKGWLLGCVWPDRSEQEKPAVVDCILSQEGWRFLSRRLGFMRREGIPDGESKLILKDLWVGLIEQHGTPHLATCPDHHSAGDRPPAGNSGP